MKKSIDNALSEEEQRMVLQGLLSRKIWRFYELLAKWAPIPLMLWHWYGVWDYGHCPRPTILDTNDNGECGFSEEEERIVQRNLLYWMERRHHFDEKLGRACIANIYYFKDDVTKEYAPFFGYEEMKEEYDKQAWMIPDYTMWDFAVTMNKMFAENIDVIGKWSRSKETLKKRISELSVSFLCDESTNHPTDKIWWYMNS